MIVFSPFLGQEPPLRFVMRFGLCIHQEICSINYRNENEILLKFEKYKGKTGIFYFSLQTMSSLNSPVICFVKHCCPCILIVKTYLKWCWGKTDFQFHTPIIPLLFPIVYKHIAWFSSYRCLYHTILKVVTSFFLGFALLLRLALYFSLDIITILPLVMRSVCS